MKRLCMCLVAAALAFVLTGCQSAPEETTGKATESGSPITDEKLSLTAMQFELDNQAIDFGNLWFYQQLEEKTNIHIEFDEVKQADWETKLNLMFASGSYRDLILRGSLDVEEYGVGQHLVLALDEYLQKDMPNYTSRLKLNNAGASLISSDGHTYKIGFLISQGVNTNGHFFINKAWLDALSLPVPQTITELTDTLRAFRDQDPNGNGLKDEIPYQATFNDNNTGLYNAFACWGVPMNEYFICLSDEGRATFPARMQGFRQCVEWLHQLWTEGLLDIECITQGQNLWGAKVNQNTAGLFTYWRLTNSVIKPEIASQFACMLPCAPQGYSPKVSRILDVPEFGAALTKANTHVEESLRWLDAQMETETMLISQNGYVGDMLLKGVDGRYHVGYTPVENELYSVVPVICGQFFAPKDYYTKVYEPAPHRLEKIEYSDMYERSGVMEQNSFQILTILSPMTEEQSKRIQELRAALKTQINDSLVSFLAQGVTDESWQAFLDELDNIGQQEYVDIYQAMYRAYLAKQGASK